MTHSYVDIARWIKIFSLNELQRKSEKRMRWVLKRNPELYPVPPTGKRLAFFYPWACAITSPYHLAVIEQYRRARLDAKQISTGKATDIFVMASGEPEGREITKFGGLPYWPRDNPWPAHKGKPLTFLGQICFADSKDLTGPLPGDVLLIFTHGEVDEVTSKSLHFKWQRISAAKLITASDMPKTEFCCRPCFGCLFRTVDLPGLLPRFRGIDGPSRCAILEGTKIGGVPHWIQGAKDLAGRFLCSVGSIKPKIGKYPFINRSRVVKEFDDYLAWGDMGSLYVFIDKSGNLTCTIQNY